MTTYPESASAPVDSLKERLRRHVDAGTDGVWTLCEEALARIEALEAEWAAFFSKLHIAEATIATLQGKLDRAVKALDCIGRESDDERACQRARATLIEVKE